MYRTVFRTNYILVECAAAKQARFLSIVMLSSAKTTGAANNSGPVCHNPADDNTGAFLDDEMVPVEKCDDGVRGLFYADDMIGVDVHLLLVHAG